MKLRISLKHEFVEYIPKSLKEKTIYISIPFATAAHKCCCGCGNEVITPISPTDWQLIFDGQSISLNPSIGNWGFACQSHYWIERNTVKWAPQWSKDRIRAGRALDALVKEEYFNRTTKRSGHDEIADMPRAGSQVKEGFWRKVTKWLL